MAKTRPGSHAPVYLSAEEAISVLKVWGPEGEEPKVHTFLGGIGADWDAEKARQAIRDARWLAVTDGLARALGHGIAVEYEGRVLAVQHDEEQLKALLARRELRVM